MATHDEDSRQFCPRDMGEVEILQEALAPTCRNFVQVTAREPPPISPWKSYAKQSEMLQIWSDRYWIAEDRKGNPPKIAQLDTWTGGIANFRKAKFVVTEEAAAKYTHSHLFRWNDGPAKPGSILWEEQMFLEVCLDNTRKELEDGKAREEERTANPQDTGNGGDPGPENDLEAILDSVVAEDPERYIAWLSSRGYAFYKWCTRSQKSLSWEVWCKWFAPTTYEASQTEPLRSHSNGGIYTFNNGGSEKSHRSLLSRPTITLEQAEEGHEEWKRRRGT